MGLLNKLAKITIKTATLPVNIAMDATGINLFVQDFDDDEQSFLTTVDKCKSIARDIESLDDE